MANLKLGYVKTGSVPSNEASLFLGGNPAIVRDGVCPWWYIKSHDGVILIDATFNLEDAKALGVDGSCRREEDPLLALKHVGIEQQDVTKIILSHAHYDHIGYLDKFPGATIYVHREELKWAAIAPSWYPGYGKFTSQRLQSVADRLIPIDARSMKLAREIEVLHIGGHTPGSLAVLVDTKRGRVCLAGDNLFTYENIEKGIPIGLYHNLDEVLRFMQQVSKLADIIIPGHDPKIYDKYPDGFE